MTALTWVLAVASLSGVVLNIYKRRESFAIWTVSNATWAVIDWRAGLPAQAALMAAYCGLAVFGLWRWRPQKSPDPVAPPE